MKISHKSSQTILFMMRAGGSLIMLFSASSFAAANLSETYALAKQYDANYLAAVQQFEATKIDLPLAQAAKKPSVNASMGLIQNHDKSLPDEGENRSGAYLQTQAAFNLQQDLYNKASDFNVQAAGLAVNIAELTLGIAEETLIETVVSRYFNVLAAQDNKQLAKLERRAIKQQLDLATQRLQVGLGTKTDKFDAKARYELSNSGVIVAQNTLQDAEQALALLTGEKRQELLVLNNKKLLAQASDKAVLQDDNIAVKAENNLLYLIKQQQVKLAEIELARSQNVRSPILGWVAGISAADSGASPVSPLSSGGGMQNWNVGLQASIPLYQGGSIKLQQNKARHRLHSVQSELEQNKREVGRSIRSAQRGVQALRGQVTALALAIRASKSALNAKQAGFKAGVTTNLDVLDGQQNLFRARRDHLKASYDLINALVQFERVSGALGAEDIARINSWLK